MSRDHPVTARLAPQR